MKLNVLIILWLFIGSLTYETVADILVYSCESSEMTDIDDINESKEENKDELTDVKEKLLNQTTMHGFGLHHHEVKTEIVFKSHLKFRDYTETSFQPPELV